MPEKKIKVELEENFYRDGVERIIIIIIGVFIAIGLIVSASLYIYLNKPPPITFPVGAEWRIQPEVPLDQPYLSIADLLQWVSDVLPKAFTYDFISYNDQLKQNAYYFTANGWKTFLNYLNSYANYTNVQKYRQFISVVPKGVPILINQGLVSGRYAWWVQLPIEISYAGYTSAPSRILMFQILIIRVSTLNNLSGVGIENIIIASNTSGQLQKSG
ncbi:MAG: hypothetical protein A3F11_08290 [Gammaproteobacteria bacterium RIFCSPHIGHO2_12_FULL_37_14]|nr:MAG: hypothetical protein A3F11_08290 [Gammaproteobacteria bacterium RIFCSPHIGHO2_12_FULL_37_14]